MVNIDKRALTATESEGVCIHCCIYGPLPPELLLLALPFTPLLPGAQLFQDSGNSDSSPNVNKGEN